MAISLGIDPSTSNTGIVVLKKDSRLEPVELLYHGRISYPKLKGHPRQSAIASDLIDILNKYRPDRVTMEGYGLSFKHSSSVIPLVELSGLLRYFLIQYGYSYLDPKPTELKKFVTGKGNADKQVMMAAISKRWGFTTKSPDEADAYGLAMVGFAQLGLLETLSVAEMETIYALKLTTTPA